MMMYLVIFSVYVVVVGLVYYRCGLDSAYGLNQFMSIQRYVFAPHYYLQYKMEWYYKMNSNLSYWSTGFDYVRDSNWNQYRMVYEEY